MNANMDMDGRIRQALDELETEPRMASFGEMLQKLEAAKQKKRRRFFLWFGSGLVLALTLGIGAWWYAGKNATTAQGIASANVRSEALAHNIHKVNENPVSSSSSSSSVAANTGTELSTAQTSTLSSTTSTSIQAQVSNKRQAMRSVTPAVPHQHKHSIVGLSATTAASSTQGSTAATSSAQSKTTAAETDSRAITNSAASSTSSVSNTIVNAAPEQFQYLASFPVTQIGGTPEEPSMALPLISGTVPDSSARTRHIHFFVGIAASPLLYKSIYTVNDRADYPAAFRNKYYHARKAANPWLPGYMVNARAGVSFRSHAQLMADVSYFQIRSKENAVIPDTSTPSLPSVNPGFAAAPSGNSAYTNTYNYLGLGLQFNWHALVNKSSPWAGIGLSANKLLGANSIAVDNKYHYASYARSQEAPFAKWMFTGRAQIGCSNMLSKRLRLQTALYGFMALSSVYDKDYLSRQKPWGLGLDVGLYYQLR